MRLTISIHALVKRATVLDRLKREVAYISIHALVKRATDWTCLNGVDEDDFNPRPREEGDYPPRPLHCQRAISIHALVKRATTVGS